MEKYDSSLIFKKNFTSRGLKSLLKQLVKEDLFISVAIMTGYEYNLTKEELIDFFCDNYKDLLNDALKSFHSEILDFLDLIVKNNGEIEYYDEIDPRFVLLLKMYLIAFPVIKDGKNKVIMSTEVFNFLDKYDKGKINEQIQLNDLVVTYTRGLLDCYGYYEAFRIFDYIHEYEKLDLDFDDYFLLINNDSFIYGYDFKNEIVYHYQIAEIKNFFETREKYQNLDYYHLTKKEITDGFDLSDEEDELLDFYENQLYMPEDMAYQGLYILKDAIQLEMPLAEIKNMLKQFDISTYELKQLEKIVEKIANHTRLWSLKGHTKNEIKIPKMLKFPAKK